MQGCNCETTSGNLDIRLLNADTTFATFKNITLKAISGNITVRVPRGFKANLDLSVKSGHKDVPSGSTETALNGGYAARTISCDAISGNIRIVEE